MGNMDSLEYLKLLGVILILVLIALCVKKMTHGCPPIADFLLDLIVGLSMITLILCVVLYSIERDTEKEELARIGRVLTDDEAVLYYNGLAVPANSLTAEQIYNNRTYTISGNEIYIYTD